MMSGSCVGKYGWIPQEFNAGVHVFDKIKNKNNCTTIKCLQNVNVNVL